MREAGPGFGLAVAVPVAVDESSIKDIPGAKVVWDKGFLGVVADREWDAIQAAEKLKVEWSAVQPPFPAQASLYDHIRKAPVRKRQVEKENGNVEEAFKTADAIAIVDQGHIVVQGSIDELTGRAATIIVATSDDLRAQALLDGHGAEPTEGGLRVPIADDSATAAINRLLVEAGLDVYRLEPERATLERRFLEITSRLGEAA